MDKNEVLKILETAKDENGEVPMRLVRQAFEKLSEPCEDAVSRKDVVEFLDDWMSALNENCHHQSMGDLKIIKNDFENLPSVTPKPEPQWIPCSETVDIPDHEIMACDKYGEMMFGYLVYEDDQWLCESDGSVMYDPKAWCELPEPYREEGEE